MLRTLATLAIAAFASAVQLHSAVQAIQAPKSISDDLLDKAAYKEGELESALDSLERYLKDPTLFDEWLKEFVGRDLSYGYINGEEFYYTIKELYKINDVRLEVSWDYVMSMVKDAKHIADDVILLDEAKTAFKDFIYRQLEPYLDPTEAIL